MLKDFSEKLLQGGYDRAVSRAGCLLWLVITVVWTGAVIIWHDDADCVKAYFWVVLPMILLSGTVFLADWLRNDLEKLRNDK